MTLDMTLAMILLFCLGEDKGSRPCIYHVSDLCLGIFCTFLVCYCICGLDGMDPYEN